MMPRWPRGNSSPCSLTMRTSKPGVALPIEPGRIGNSLELLPTTRLHSVWPIHFVGIDAEGRAHPVEQFAAERFAAGEDAAQPDAGMPDVGLPHQLQRRRRQEHVADAVIGHHLHRRLRLELSRAMPDDRHAVIPGREQRVDQPADPGPVGRRPHQVAGLGQEVVTHLDIRQMAEHHAMGVQRALRISRGARGVDDHRGIVGRGIDGGKFRRRRLERRPERFGAGRRAVADDIDVRQVRQPVADFLRASPSRSRR